MAWLYKRPDSEVWWLGVRINGKQILRSTGHRDEAQARKVLAKYETMDAAKRADSLTEELFRRLVGTTTTPRTLKAELEEWLQSCEGTTAAGTQGRYAIIADHLLEFTNATDKAPMLRDITKPQFEAFLRHLAKTQSVGTVNLTRKIMAGFFNRALADGKIIINPVKGTRPMKAKKAEKVNRRALTMTELQQLWGKAKTDFWKYMLAGGFYSGLRMGDLICLHRSEIDLPNNRLKLEAGKTGVDLEIPLAPVFRAAIEKRLRECKSSATYLWPEHAKIYDQQGSGTFSNEFYDEMLAPCGLVPKRANKKKKKDANGRNGKRVLNAVSFHSLRHTFISQLKASGAHQSVVKELAGHSSDVVNDLYTHTPPQLLSDAIAKLPEVTA